MANEHTFAENNEVELLIVPAAQGSLNTSWRRPFADGGGAERVVYFLVIGATAGNTDFKLQEATTDGGTPSDITGAAITALTTSTDEVMVSIEIGPGALDDLNGYKWVRGVVTVASGTPPYCVFSIKRRLRRPGEFTQPSSYSQQVLVLG